MKMREKSDSQPYEQHLQDLRRERKSEAKQAERLGAVLAEKTRVGTAKSAGAAVKAA
jgi:hypothetical protein